MKTANSSFILCFAATLIFLGASPTVSQSINQNLPTPVTGPEIRGRIKARDIGDSRLTTYFYAFDGEQGDVFINVVTKNFNGDIDIFTVDGLRPLTKIVIYASGGLDETGRLVYLRKPERLLLRIEGRTPDDDPATFAIKFAGSFVALKPIKGAADLGPVAKEIDDPGGVRLNSAGAVIADPTSSKASQSDVKKSPSDTEAGKAASKTSTDKKEVKKLADGRTGEGTGSSKTSEAAKTTKSPPAVGKESNIETKKDPLAGVKFIVMLKDGTSFQRPMNEVQRFSADKGFLLVITKDGAIVRYLLTDIASITMQ